MTIPNKLKEQADAILKADGFKDAESPTEERKFRYLQQNLAEQSNYTQATASFYTKCEGYLLNTGWNNHTAGEKAIFRLYSEGNGYSRIAKGLKVSIKRARCTVEKHLKLAGLVNPKQHGKGSKSP